MAYEVLLVALVVLSGLTVKLRRTRLNWLAGVGFLVVAIGWLTVVPDRSGCFGGYATGPAQMLTVCSLLSLLVGLVSRSNELERRRRPPTVVVPRATVVSATRQSGSSARNAK